MTLRRITAVAALAAALLAGCSREPAPPPPAEETVQEPEVAEPAPAPAAPPPASEAPPPPSLSIETNFEEQAEEPIDPSDQTLEDADATGLTTRATRTDEGQAEPATNAEREGGGL
ncbi:MAG: hypothetical protein JWL91_1340 [Sphingomonas bacterium]|nr:hypothetical protein [Sphingomonas bacterium]MDB5689464.1 hypothetical protein [Sphingomonas bacterium]